MSPTNKVLVTYEHGDGYKCQYLLNISLYVHIAMRYVGMHFFSYFSLTLSRSITLFELISYRNVYCQLSFDPILILTMTNRISICVCCQCRKASLQEFVVIPFVLNLRRLKRKEISAR